MKFKSYVIVLFSFISMVSVSAQRTEKELQKHAKSIEKSKESSKGILSLDTLFYKGMPYCILEVDSKFLGSILKATVKNLDGSMAGYLNWTTINDYSTDPNKNGFMQVSFTNEVASAYIQNLTPERFIVDYHLFTDGKLDAMSVKRLLESFPNPKNRTTITTIVTTNSVNKTPVTPSRNKSATIFQGQNQLTQDNSHIGTYTENTVSYGVGKELHFYNSQNIIVAIAVGDGAAPVSYKVTCYGVGSVLSRYPSSNAMVPSMTQDVKVRLAFEPVDIAKYLVEVGLL